MHLQENIMISPSGKTYKSVLLRESYREGGKVKKRSIANLSNCKPEEIEAIRLALKHKDNLQVLGSLADSVELREGKSVGALWTVYLIARRLGIEKALGTNRAGRLALWQVLARVLDQGSRLSALRLAEFHAFAEVLGFSGVIVENDLYKNLGWLSAHQDEIEQRLFKLRRGEAKPKLFLYDVTSSYLEGNYNELADWGYNRDRKRGKKQIVIGLLCDEEGEPVSIEVFRGNTQDLSTFGSQVKKAAERFGCEFVTFVGDRGMIKRPQIEDIQQAGYHYITAITKPEIDSLLISGVLQMDLFDEDVVEVIDEGVRYVLRRNPQRAAEIAAIRQDKQTSFERFINDKNKYLSEHPQARVETALRKVHEKAEKLRIDRWLKVQAQDRMLGFEVDESALGAESRLDGCYVIKTDLPASVAAKEVIHERYKDLVKVEKVFRTMKTAHLEIRPVYVRRENSTRGHVLVVMLAYLIVRELSRAWANLNVTVEEGLKQLSTLCALEMVVNGERKYQQIPTPRDQSVQLLQASNIRLPVVLNYRKIIVDTRRKLPKRRKLP